MCELFLFLNVVVFASVFNFRRLVSDIYLIELLNAIMQLLSCWLKILPVDMLQEMKCIWFVHNALYLSYPLLQLD